MREPITADRLHSQDVRQLIVNGLVDPKRLLELFSSIEDQLYRYPDLDGPTFRRAVERVSERDDDLAGEG